MIIFVALFETTKNAAYLCELTVYFALTFLKLNEDHQKQSSYSDIISRDDLASLFEATQFIFERELEV